MNTSYQEHEVEAACTRLCIDFAYLVDSRDYERLAALFTPQGTFERRGEVLRGRDAILRGMQARPAEVITRHVCTSIRIQVESDGTATGSCYLLLFHGVGGACGAPTVAEYRDVFVRGSDGWRIHSRVATLAF